jgi:hypothetical protein
MTLAMQLKKGVVLKKVKQENMVDVNDISNDQKLNLKNNLADAIQRRFRDMNKNNQDSDDDDSNSDWSDSD